MESCPIIFSFCSADEFDCNVLLLWGIDVVPGVDWCGGFFEVYLSFNVFWKVVLLTPGDWKMLGGEFLLKLDWCNRQGECVCLGSPVFRGLGCKA